MKNRRMILLQFTSIIKRQSITGICIRKGTVNDLPEYDSDSVAAFTKTWEELQLHVLINVSGETQTLALQENLQEAALENGLYTGEEEADLTEGNLTIPPYGIVFLRSGMK